MKDFFLDEIDYKILDILVEEARTPLTDIAKKLQVSPGTIHLRVKKMEEKSIIQGSTLKLDYRKLGHDSVSHLGILLEKTALSYSVMEDLKKIPNITAAYINSGKWDIFCKVRTKDVEQLRLVILEIGKIKGVVRTESMIALKECINDKRRMMQEIFKSRIKKKN